MQSLALVDFSKENIDQDSKIQNDNHVRISKYKNIFAKGYTPNWSEKVFVNKNVKKEVSWMNVINDLNGEEIVTMFCQKKNAKNISIRVQS